MKRISVLFALLAAASLSLTVIAYQAPQQQGPPVVEVEKIKDNLFMLKGGGGNTAVYIGAAGVTVVDHPHERRFRILRLGGLFQGTSRRDPRTKIRRGIELRLGQSDRREDVLLGESVEPARVETVQPWWREALHGSSRHAGKPSELLAMHARD